LKLPQARGLKARPVMESKGLLARTAWSVHDRDLLLAGMELKGPTLIADRTATITLLKGDVASVLEDGCILMRTGRRS
jgi:hypothetical protein